MSMIINRNNNTVTLKGQTWQLYARDKSNDANGTRQAPGEIKAEKIEGGLQIQKVPFSGGLVSMPEKPQYLGAGKGHYVSGVVHKTTALTEEAYQMLKDAGYETDENGVFVFDIGKQPAKYSEASEQLPKFQFDWSSGEALLNSIKDRFYRSSTPRETGIVLHLEPPKPKAAAEAPTDLAAPKEGALKVGDTIQLGQKRFGTTTEDYDVTLTSKGNFNYMGEQAYIEGAYQDQYHVGSGSTNPYRHDFLRLNNGFIRELESKVAQGQDFDELLDQTSQAAGLRNMNEDGSFSTSDGSAYYSFSLHQFAARALEYFGGYSNGYEEGVLVETGETIRAFVDSHHSDDEIDAVYNQLRTAILESAEGAASGTKIRIGELEFSLDELVNTHTVLSNAVSSTRHYGNNPRYYASLGLAVASVENFTANNLSPDMADKVNSMFEKRVEDSLEFRAELSSAARARMAERRKEHEAMYPSRSRSPSAVWWNRTEEDVAYYGDLNADWKGDTFIGDVYRKFRNIGKDGSQTFEQAFREAMQWMEREFGKWYDYVGHTAVTKAKNTEDMSRELWARFRSLDLDVG